MLTVLTIILCVVGPLLWVLYIQRGARRRLALTPEHPDTPYDTSGAYVIGGRWGFSPLTGELGYEHYKFADDQTATYMCGWLNDHNDHRSLAMAFFDLAARVEAQRKADLNKVRFDPWHCDECGSYIDRKAARTLSSGRCYDCEIAHHRTRLVASYQVPGAQLADMISYIPGLETRARTGTQSTGPL